MNPKRRTTPEISLEQAVEFVARVACGKDTWKGIAASLDCSIAFARERSTHLAGSRVKSCHTTRHITVDDAIESHRKCCARESKRWLEAEKYGVTPETMKLVWNRLGLGHVPRCLGRGAAKLALSTYSLERMHGLVASGESTLAEVARNADCQSETLQRHWKWAGMSNPCADARNQRLMEKRAA